MMQRDGGASQSETHVHRALSEVERMRRALAGPRAIALGGGGARGIAYAGVVRALARYPSLAPHCVVGTSVGSVAAALLASGVPAEHIQRFSEELDWFSHVIELKDLLRWDRGSAAGLVSNRKLGDIVNQRLDGRSFDDLPIDLAVVATDLEHRARVIMTSRRLAERIDHAMLEAFLPSPADGLPGIDTIVVSNVSDVGLAVRASCAVPGVFRPVAVAGRKLLDGGLVDQTPTDVARASGARFTVAVSLGLAFISQALSTPLHSLSSTIGILGMPQLRRSLDLADIGFEISGIRERSAVKAHQFDLIEIGDRDTEAALYRYFGRDVKSLIHECC